MPQFTDLDLVDCVERYDCSITACQIIVSQNNIVLLEATINSLMLHDLVVPDQLHCTAKLRGPCVGTSLVDYFPRLEDHVLELPG